MNSLYPKHSTLYYFVLFLIKGNSELWGTHLNKFITSFESKKKKFLMYDKSTSKNYKVSTKHFQVEQMCPTMYSYDLDVLQTFSILVSHMLPITQDGHLFPTIKHNSRNDLWLKKGINVGERNMWHWMKQMAQFIGIDQDITNKSRHVTFIKKMVIVQWHLK